MNLLHVFATAWNDELIIRDFIDFYRQRIPDCKITIYDNMSDDNTAEICKQNNCEVIPFDTNGKMDEHKLIEVRNNCWKNSDSKWIIVCDSDEWVDVSVEKLENADWNVMKCTGYEMVGTGEPMNELVYGVESIGYSKPVLFLKEAIKESNFAPGSHNSNPTPNDGYTIKVGSGINLYHTKWRDWGYGINRQHTIAKKVAEESRRNGWNFHYGLPDATHLDYYSNLQKNKKQVR